MEQTLRSLDGAARPVPSPWLYQQVRHRLEARRAATGAETPDWRWVLQRLTVASVLVAVNVATFAYRAELPAAQTTPAAATEYSYPTLGGY